MSSVLEVAYNVISPVFLIIGIAVLFSRRFDPDPRPLSKLIIYVFSPALVLDGIAHSNLRPEEIGQIVVMVALFAPVMALIGWGIARLFKFERRLEGTFILTVMAINAGNYGLSVNEFAFGEAGLQRAMVYFVLIAWAANTLGVFVVSRGTASMREATLNVLKIPLPYATLLGLLIKFGEIGLPLPLARAIALLGQASVPCMLVVLGIQLARTSVRGQLKPILLATGTRLLVAPVVALLLVGLLGIDGLTRQVVLVQSSMSTAVIAGILALEFDGDSEFASATIVVSTLASIVTLSVLLSLLGG